MLAELERWGRERGLTELAETVRAFLGAHLAGNCADVHAMAFSAAREQYLAELRTEGRRLVTEVAARLPPAPRRR